MQTDSPVTPEPVVDDRQYRLWAMLLHLSVFMGYVVPIFGLITPIVIWQIKKEEMPAIDEHGRNVVNWIISMVIYAAVSTLLLFLFIGIPLLMFLGLIGIIFPIIGGIKANNGIVWKYPLTITFI